MIRNRTNRLPDRDGFSLVELLVVIAILAVLTAIAVAVIGTVRTSTTEKTNEEILSKLQTALDTQRDALANAVKKMRSDKTPEFQAFVTFCDGDEDRAEALVLHFHMKKEMPQTFAEATSVFGIPGVWQYQPRTTFKSVLTITPVPSTELQAAALLFLNLNEKGVGSSDGFQADLAGQTDIGFRAFRDAWGQPITFVRHLQNAELNGAPYANTKGGSQDPLDPRGKLATWTNTTKRAAALSALGLANFNGQNKVATVVSAGKNKTFELANLMSSDDVPGYRTKKQGQRAD